MPDELEKEDNIERIKRKLYSQDGAEIQREKKFELRNRANEVPEGWQSDDMGADEPTYAMARSNLHDHSLLKRFLAVAVIFFIAAVGIFSYLYFGGLNTISNQNVGIEIIGPVSVGGGDVVPIEIKISNKNAIPLQSVLLKVEFPENTRDAKNVSKPLVRYTKELGEIPVSGEATDIIEAILFGEENSTKEILVSIEYRVPDSSAQLVKEKLYEPTISSAPVIMDVALVREISSGKEFTMTINIASNSGSTVEDLILRAEYPFGFEFIEGTPDPTFDDNVWKIGDLQPEQKRKIVITGSLAGDDGATRVFNFSVGTQGDSDEKNIGIPLIARQESIRIERPFIGTTLALNGRDSEEVAVSANSAIRGDITYVNNLPNQVTDVAIEVKLSGSVLDRRSVDAGSGFYRSIDDTILWDQTRLSNLAVLNPGERGTVSFSVKPIAISANNLALYENPELSFVVNVKGTRISESNVPEQIASNDEARAILGSNIAVQPRIVYSGGPFINTGPIPPRAEQETTYTVYMTVTNTTNDVVDGRVVTTLPSYVRWVGAVSPPNERVVYNRVGSQVVWDVGDIPAGSGIISTPREVAFQVAILPSLSQIGNAPILVNASTVSGFDIFTENTIEASSGVLKTNLSNDPNFGFNDGRVTQ